MYIPGNKRKQKSDLLSPIAFDLTPGSSAPSKNKLISIAVQILLNGADGSDLIKRTDLRTYSYASVRVSAPRRA